MNPLKLELNNFGPIGHADIDLGDISLAAITGANGAGKSTTFTIAPIWALFGTTKNGCSADNLVKLGTDTGSVSFEFDHRGDHYKVVRTRSTNGKGKSSLELQKMIDGLWASISGTTIKETEEKIQALLGLDSNTLISSSMILQGRANEFTQKAPGERKAILAQILGLDEYEVLQAKAKEHVAGISREIEDIKADIARRSEIVQEKGSYLARLFELDADIAKTAESIKQHEESLKNMRMEMAKVDNAQAEIDKLKGKVTELNGKKNKLFADRQINNDLIQRCNDFLAREQEIIEKCAKLDEAEKTLIQLEPLMKQCEALKNEHSALSLSNNRETAAVNSLIEEWQKVKDFLDKADEYIRAENEVAVGMAEIEKAEAEQLESLKKDKEISEKQAKISTMRFEYQIKRDCLATEISNLAQKAEMFKKSCCIDRLAAQMNPCVFLQDAANAVSKLAEKEQIFNTLSDADVVAEENELAEMQANHKQVDRREYIARMKEAVSKYKEQAAKAALIPDKRNMISSYESQIAAKKEALTANFARRNEICAELEKIPWSVTNVPELKASLVDADKWRAAKENIPVRKEQLSKAQEQQEAQNKEIGEISETVNSLNMDIFNLSSLVENASTMRLTMNTLESQINTNNADIRAKIGQKAVCEQKLKEIKQADEDIKVLTAKLIPLSQDYEEYSLLTKAFGRDGIPALIIESAVPELEVIANEILSAMSNGRHSLEFRTQRELKSKSGMAETLDIIVRDWAGERPYETFSGGEQLRIDYAIRFALAELLTRKAGSRIEWLVIDEGLGSQDREHRELVLESIRNVSNRFKKVFVITHVEEAQGAFPQQIRFENTPNGVEITTL